MLQGFLPADFDLARHRYFEPFAGGAALLWALSGHPSARDLPATSPKRRRRMVLNDVNGELATTYRVLQDDCEALIVRLEDMAGDVSEERYYQVRAATPADPVEVAARLIYLNRTTFNGLYRVNRQGQFNVPYGKLANPTVCDAARLRACSAWLRHVEVRSGSFVAAVNDARAGDVVYLDPPYIPLTATASFAGYAKDGFGELDQWALSGVVAGLSGRGVRVVMSNSCTETTSQVFGAQLDLYAVDAKRSIAASSSSRAPVQEVVGVNFAAGECADPGLVRSLRQVSSRADGEVR